MRLIVALDRFLQFCQRAHAGFVRQLLLAFPARQQKVAFPSRRVGLDITRHLASLIWGDHRALSSRYLEFRRLDRDLIHQRKLLASIDRRLA